MSGARVRGANLARMGLPILPALKKSPAPSPDDEPVTDGEDDAGTAAASLGELLDGLDDSQVQELVASAEALDPGEQEPDPGDVDEAAEGEDDGTGDTDPAPPPDGEDDAPTDDEAGDADASGVAPEDLDAIDQQLSIDVEEAATVVGQMQDLADGESDSAPDVAKLIKQATGLQDKIAKQQKLLAKAIKAEDVQAAAQAGMDATDALTAMQALLTAAQALGAKSEAPTMKPGDHPALKMWAAKVQGKKLAARPALAPPPPAK